MIEFGWDREKNELLMQTRNISFERIVEAVNQGSLLADLKHPGPEYAHQHMMIVEIDLYAYVVPYVEYGKSRFLKTIYPSRDATKKYL